MYIKWICILHLHLADTFIQSDSLYIFFIRICVPWESKPQPFALLTQCSTTEPQEHHLESKQGSL